MDRLTLFAGKTILILERETLLAGKLKARLVRLGARIVGPMLTPDAALEALESRKPIDGAILDLRLEGDDVFPVAERLQALGIPFVFAVGENALALRRRYPGYVLCAKPAKLSEIAVALFGGRRRTTR